MLVGESRRRNVRLSKEEEKDFQVKEEWKLKEARERWEQNIRCRTPSAKAVSTYGFMYVRKTTGIKEIATPEPYVVRLKETTTELHHQLNQLGEWEVYRFDESNKYKCGGGKVVFEEEQKPLRLDILMHLSH
ncbi:hypothetical protein Tco_1509443 [Tanacetum coccineum]